MEKRLQNIIDKIEANIPVIHVNSEIIQPFDDTISILLEKKRAELDDVERKIHTINDDIAQKKAEVLELTVYLCELRKMVSALEIAGPKHYCFKYST